MDREVKKHGRAEWQGNEISSKEAFRGSLYREVNKKRKLLHLKSMTRFADAVVGRQQI